MKRRVAITGIGLVTPVGNDVATTWAALLAGKSGGAPITLFDASGFSTRIAAEVKGFDDDAIVADRKLLKFANRSHRFALAAAEQALRDAGIAPTRRRRRALGLRGRRRHDGRRLRRPRGDRIAHCGAGRRARCRRGCSTDPRGQRSAGVLPQPGDRAASRCSRAASASAATRRRCTPRARRAARRSARR